MQVAKVYKITRKCFTVNANLAILYLLVTKVYQVNNLRYSKARQLVIDILQFHYNTVSKLLQPQSDYSGNKKAIYCPLVDSFIPKFFTRTSLQQRNRPRFFMIEQAHDALCDANSLFAKRTCNSLGLP
nr:MAG TPA: hypothetical protein [Caudoviricetes sp.]